MKPIPSNLVRTIPAALLLLLMAVVPALANHMDVDIWTDRGNDAVYEPGDAMRVKVRTTMDAYLLVYEIDSEGNVSLLYPLKRGNARLEARRTLRLPDDASGYQLVVERATGQGFLVAVASERPFRDLPWYLRPFDPQAASVGYEGEPDGKDEEGFDDKGRVVGDPYVAMERIRRRVMEQAGDAQDFATSYSTYYVHEQVRYPRYLCNDCHRPHYWAWWGGFDPYYARCSVMDFRVNWSWCWGPQAWTSFMPYYFYCVRSDCPPRYRPIYNNHSRFSSWDGWNRWNSLWGGGLRRFKPAPAPAGYLPPSQGRVAWRQGGQTPPGYVPPEVRRLAGNPGSGPQGWMQRDRGDGNPVWRLIPRPRPDQGGSSTTPPAAGNRRWPDWRRGGDNPQGGEGGSGGQSNRGEPRFPRWSPGNSTPDESPRYEPPRHERPRYEPPRYEPPRNDPPRNDPPRQDPPHRDPPRDPPSPNWKQPSQPEYPKWAPPPPKPNGHGG